MTDYEIADKTGRELFEEKLNEWGIESYFFPIEPYSGVDVFWNSTPDSEIKRTFCGEIKVRNCNIEDYPDFILEINKYKALMSLLPLKYHIYYINIFKNGMIMWNLNKIRVEDMDIRAIPRGKTTVEDNGKEYGDAYYLRADQGRIWR